MQMYRWRCFRRAIELKRAELDVCVQTVRMYGAACEDVCIDASVSRATGLTIASRYEVQKYSELRTSAITDERDTLQ